MKLANLLWLLVVVFMIHDFEEIIMINPWLQTHSSALAARWPRSAARLLPRLAGRSTSALALAVAEEFVLLAALTWAAVEYALYSVWAGVLVAFFLHLIVHWLQFALLRRYVPVLWTSIPAGAYCLYALAALAQAEFVIWPQVAVWAVVASVAVLANVLFAHWLAARFDAWLGRYAPAGSEALQDA